MSLKQRKIKFEPRIKLNYNIYMRSLPAKGNNYIQWDSLCFIYMRSLPTEHPVCRRNILWDDDLFKSNWLWVTTLQIFEGYLKVFFYRICMNEKLTFWPIRFFACLFSKRVQYFKNPESWKLKSPSSETGCQKSLINWKPLLQSVIKPLH